MKVLVVDDQAEVRDGAQALLAAMGHHVAVAQDAQSAFELALEDPPALALMDIQMPDVNGYEAARMLRTEFGRAIWICALTASPVDMPTAIHCGFDGVMAKPISKYVLLNCLVEVERQLRLAH